MTDLGRWLTGGYHVPAAPDTDESDSEAESDRNG
jgi:endogenous inhibitor of DNA gyrase (YacG/DUF329 family)